MRVDQRIRIFRRINRQADGVFFVVRFKGINPLAIDIAWVVVLVLLDVKCLAREGVEVDGKENMVNALMAFVLRNIQLFFEIDLFLIVIPAGKPFHHGFEVAVEDAVLR